MSNQTDDDYTYAIRRREYWLQGYSYVFYLVKIAVMVLSVGLNITVLVTVKLSNRLRKIPYLFMSSLAVSDLIFACNGIFHSALVMLAVCTKDWPTRPMANSFGTCITFMFFASMFSTYGNLVLISLERWVYISQPFWYQRFISQRVAVVTIAFVWSAAVIINLDILIQGGNFPVISSQIVRYSIIFPIHHFIWCFIICSVCTHISIITLRHVKAINKTSFVGIPATIDKANLRLVLLKKKLIHARMLLFVFGSFFILLTRSICCNIYFMLSSETNGTLIGFAKVLLCAHSNTNFFVYAFQDKDFKLALRQLFAKCGFGRYENKTYPIQGLAVEFNAYHNKKISLSFHVNNGERTMFTQITSDARMAQDYHAEIPRNVDKSTVVQQYGLVLSK